MTSNLETFTDLLIEISNEVLINRPCLVSRFISRMLESYLDRRTLWEMEMAAFNSKRHFILLIGKILYFFKLNFVKD